MKQGWKRLLGAAVMLACASSVHATFHSRDSIFGQDTLVWDEDTGLQWLSLNVTRGQSYNSVFESLGTTYSGFHIASDGDLSTLMANVGIQHEQRAYYAPLMTTEQGAAVNQTLRMLGGTGSGENVGLRGFRDWGDAGYVDLVTGERTGSIYLQAFGAYASSSYAAYYDDAVFFYKPTAYDSHGVFLVTAPVPEPETYLLMLGGLAAVVAARRKRRH